jgi:hypothetical protein
VKNDMAKRRAYRRRSGGPNKAQAIRDILNASGKQTPTKDVVKALGEQGIVVSAAHVSNIKAQLRRAGGTNGAGRRGRRPAADSVSIAALMEAKRMADRLGGIEQARAVFEALSRLQ